MIVSEPALAGHAGLQLDGHPLASVVGSEELLPAGEHQPHRTLGHPGQDRDVGLEVEVTLGAEPTTEQRHDDPHLGLGDLEGLGDPGARGEGDLRAGPHRDRVAGPLRDDGARLDGHALSSLGDVTALDHDVGAGHRDIRVALDDGRPAQDVAVSSESLIRGVGLPLRVEHDGIRVHVGDIVGGAGQDFVFDLDQRSGLPGNLDRPGSDAGDDVALPEHHLLGEQATIFGHPPVTHIRDVLVGDDGEHAGEGLGRGRVDPHDPGMWVVGIAECRMQLPGESQVGGVTARAGHLLLTVGTDEGP